MKTWIWVAIIVGVMLIASVLIIRAKRNENKNKLGDKKKWVDDCISKMVQKAGPTASLDMHKVKEHCEQQYENKDKILPL